MAIRSFSLTNKNGVVWNLNSPDSFYEAISGFGFERDFDFEIVGNGFLEMENELQQPNPKGNIRFKDYATYNQFIKFAQANPLKLAYAMPGVNDVYYLEVKIESIEKTEKEVDCLVCPISFLGIGHFYKLISAENQASTVGKVYPYTYPYTYVNNASGTVTLESDTNLDSPVKITILGPCTNPSWTHYVDDIAIATGKVDCSMLDGNRLVIDTTNVPYTIKQYDSFMNELSDEYENSDFSTQRFISLKYGTNKIGFTHEGLNDLSVTVEGWLAYESV